MFGWTVFRRGAVSACRRGAGRPSLWPAKSSRNWLIESTVTSLVIVSPRASAFSVLTHRLGPCQIVHTPSPPVKLIADSSVDSREHCKANLNSEWPIRVALS